MEFPKTDDQGHLPKELPGDNLMPFGNINAFSQKRIDLNEGQTVDTHQTRQLQEPQIDPSSHVMNQAAAFEEQMRRTVNPELIALRNQNPFVDMIPFPMRTMFVVASQANDVRDVTLPDNCQLIRFSANNSIDFFVSVQGQIQFPIAEDLTGNGVLYCPRDQWYYVRGLKNISIGLPINQSGVGIQCMVQL